MPDVKSKIDLDLGDLKDRLDDFTSTLEGAKDLMDTWQSNTKEAFAGISEGAKDSYKEQATAAEETGKKAEETGKKVKSIGQAYEETVRKMRQERGVKGIVGEMLPQQAQFIGIQDSMAQLKGSILSELPFGGLIGLMVLGGKREEEVRAMGTQVGRVFQQAGQAGRAEMSLIGNDVRRLGVMLGKGPTGLAGEAASAAAAFAQAGVDIESVVKGKFSAPIKGSRGSILEASMAIDSLFKQASGTAARQMGELIKDFNLSAQDSARVVASVGLAARDSGTSVAAFTGSIMRSAQALRTQRVDIEEVAEAQLRFQKLLERDMPGITKQFAAGYAERGMGQVSQGMAGMSVGLSAVLGERMTARGVGGEGTKTGLEAYYALREGFGGKGQTDKEAGMFQETVKELFTLAKENGRTVEEQRFFLERMGFGFEGAKAIVKVGQETAKSGDLQKAMKDNQKELNRAFVDRAAETSGFQRALLKIQNGVAKVGAGLLGVTIAGIANIVNAIRYLGGMLSGDEAVKKASWEMLGQSSEMFTRGTDMIMRGFNGAFGGLKQGALTGLSIAGGGAGMSWDKMLAKHHARQSDIERGDVYDKLGGTELYDDITKTELKAVAEEGKKEQLRRKTLGAGQAFRETTLLHGGATELRDIYAREEEKSGKGEEAVYKAMQGRDVRGMEGYEKVSPEEMRRRLIAMERKQEEMAEVPLPTGGKMKVKVIVESLEGPYGMPEG